MGWAGSLKRAAKAPSGSSVFGKVIPCFFTNFSTSARVSLTAMPRKLTRPLYLLYERSRPGASFSHVPHQDDQKFKKSGLPLNEARPTVRPSKVLTVKSGAMFFPAGGSRREKYMIPAAAIATTGAIHKRDFTSCLIVTALSKRHCERAPPRGELLVYHRSAGKGY